MTFSAWQVSGRTFLRRMYSKFAGVLMGDSLTTANRRLLRKYHHVRIDEEFRNDCKIWLNFLQDDEAVCRPFVDFTKTITARKLRFATDASWNPHLGFGCMFRTHWMYSQWEPFYIKKFKPSIEYLELYALCIAILTWGTSLANGRYIVWCDNKSSCCMVNSGASSCKNCMYLL